MALQSRGQQGFYSGVCTAEEGGRKHEVVWRAHHVGDKVAVQVWGHHDVKLLRLADQLRTHRRG